MNSSEVPQDDSPVFRGFGRKAVYALNDQGRFETVPTNGWDVEDVVLFDVLEDYAMLRDEAREKWARGELSQITYFMYKNNMDPDTCCKGMGIPRWRLNRHLRPGHFVRLSMKIKEKYAEFFRTSLNNFLTLEDENHGQ